jgi:hypothetical protein
MPQEHPNNRADTRKLVVWSLAARIRKHTLLQRLVGQQNLLKRTTDKFLLRKSVLVEKLVFVIAALNHFFLDAALLTKLYSQRETCR